MSEIQRYHTNEYGDLVKSNASYAKLCKYEDVKALERQLECYKSIAEEAIEVTPEHFDEGYGWSESIKKLKEKGEYE